MSNEQTPRVAVALREPLPWAGLLELVRTAEDAGFEAIFVPEVGNREAFAQLSAMAMVTSRLTLATGVVSMESRRPETTATAAITLHELSGGRHVLGLGAGFGRLDAFLDYADQVRRAAAGHPVGSLPPVWFAALGDRAVEAAAVHADGVVLNWCTPERVRRARETIRRARGRADAPFTVAVYVRCCLTGVEDDAPLRALREATALYASLPHYRRQLDGLGLGEEAEVAAKALHAGDLDGVPESLVDALCVRGGREAFRRRADELAEAGADVVVVYPVPAREALSSMLGTILAAAP
jgi:alkanesulfonate monooxygenase SsuD/methylene tetrahydromethanopterin reductase-like flavin-dependent oxidoreductase (luciferase family)